MKKRIYYSIIFSAVMLVSCLKDHGNYNYIELNDVKISGISSDKYEMYAFIDTLKITPEIAGEDINSSSRYKYEWKIMPRSGDETSDSINHVVGLEKDLSLPITLEAGEYRGYYRVSDTKEGTDWTATFSLTVKSLSGEGYMVLCEENGQGRLDMIATITENEFRAAYDLWREEGYNLGRPLNLLFNYNREQKSSTIYVTTSGSYRLDKNLLTDDRYNLKWSFGITPDEVHVRGTNSTTFSFDNPRELIVDEQGKLYTRNMSMPGSIFEFPINFINGRDEFEASEMIGMALPNSPAGYWPYGHTVLLYDKTNKQFLELKETNEYPTEIQFTNSGVFSAKTNRDLVFLGSTLNKYTFAVLKDAAEGKFYLYGMTLGGDAKNSQDYYLEIVMPSQQDIRFFAIHPILPYLFYATDNKVYQFDYSQPALPAKQVLSYDDGEIASLNFYPLVGWNPYQTWERNKAQLMVVGINKRNGQENPGEVEFYTAPPLGASLVLKEKLDGFGKIITITQRER